MYNPEEVSQNNPLDFLVLYQLKELIATEQRLEALRLQAGTDSGYALEVRNLARRAERLSRMMSAIDGDYLGSAGSSDDLTYVA